MRIALFACMRDEGPFLLEWIAYHRQLGFNECIIATNQCRDGSDLMLDALAEAGVVRHLRHLPPKGVAPQESGIGALFASFEGAPPDWLLHIDADEFLWLAEDETLATLIARAGDAHVVALPWAGFGDSGHETWPGATLPYFTRRGIWPDVDRDKFKSLFRPAAFASANDHTPVRSLVANPRVISTLGERLYAGMLDDGRHHARYSPLSVALKPGPARINHYAIRSTDTFLARAKRGDGQGKVPKKYRLGSHWHLIANRNDVEDRSMLRHWPATEAGIAALRALPGVAEAEARCLAYHFPQGTAQ